tara:strand:- start:842 stop:2284 length:1443 start_codon:yes stop_codon:yes gene_type:complete
MDPLATNYDPLATCPDTCIYPPPCEDPAPTLKNSGGKIETPCGTYTQSFITFFVDTDQGVPYSWTIKDSNNNTIGSGTGQPSGQQNGIVNIQPINPPPAASPGTTQYFIDVTDENGCSISGHLLATLSSSLKTYGCTNPLAPNYNSAADCDDGSCIIVYGCMDPMSNNYDSLATDPCDSTNSGCTTTSVPACTGPGTAPGGCCVDPNGCTDTNAGNYDPSAVIDDGSCWWPCIKPDVLINQSWEYGNQTANIASASGDDGDDWKIVLIGPTLNNVNGNITMHQKMFNYRTYNAGGNDGIQPCNMPENLGGHNADWISEWSNFQTNIPGYGTHQLEWNPTISPIAYDSGWQNETLSGMSYNTVTEKFENTSGTIQIPKWTFAPNETYIIAIYRKRNFASSCFSGGHECWNTITLNSTIGNGANYMGCVDPSQGPNPDVNGDCNNSTSCSGIGCCGGSTGYSATNFDPAANFMGYGFPGCTY